MSAAPRVRSREAPLGQARRLRPIALSAGGAQLLSGAFAGTLRVWNGGERVGVRDVSRPA